MGGLVAKKKMWPCSVTSSNDITKYPSLLYIMAFQQNDIYHTTQKQKQKG